MQTRLQVADNSGAKVLLSILKFWGEQSAMYRVYFFYLKFLYDIGSLPLPLVNQNHHSFI